VRISHTELKGYYLLIYSIFSYDKNRWQKVNFMYLKMR